MPARSERATSRLPVSERLYREIARDAAGITGAPMVQLLVASRGGAARWRSAAFELARRRRASRVEVERVLGRDPACSAAPTRGASHRVVNCPPGLARELGARRGVLRSVDMPLCAGKRLLGWLRFVREGAPDRAALATYRALARQASGRLEAEVLRRAVASEVTRERRARSELQQAKETLAALNLAGTHLMVETDQGAIYGVICRELLRIGFHSAVLAAEPGPEGPRPPFRYAYSSFSAPLQRATERLLGRDLASIRLQPAEVPILRRALETGRTVFSARARLAARHLFGATEDQVRKLARLLKLTQVVLAPLRYDNGIAGMLVVAAARLRRSDPEAIDAFAAQASIALEKARLFSVLREQQALLESEVGRRTRELTLAVRALEDLDRRKDNFLANVSHELRTPLVTVLGYVDLLASEKLGELTPRQRECLRVAASSARRLRSFIEELLEFSRHELTKDSLSFAAFDVRDLVRQAALSAAPRFHARGIQMRIRVARSTPLIWGDRDRILQVFSNLLGNAERHCDDGGRVRLAAARTRPGRVEVSVGDNGSGIPAEHLERIFDRLYQVGDVVKQREKGAGLGLGLAIVKAIVEAHGGSIAVRSRVGAGTVFKFSLPTVETLEGGVARSAAGGH